MIETRQRETEASNPWLDLDLTGRVINSKLRLKKGSVTRFDTKIARIRAITGRRRRKHERNEYMHAASLTT